MDDVVSSTITYPFYLVNEIGMNKEILSFKHFLLLPIHFLISPNLHQLTKMEAGFHRFFLYFRLWGCCVSAWWLSLLYWTLFKKLFDLKQQKYVFTVYEHANSYCRDETSRDLVCEIRQKISTLKCAISTSKKINHVVMIARYCVCQLWYVVKQTKDVEKNAE